MRKQFKRVWVAAVLVCLSAGVRAGEIDLPAVIAGEKTQGVAWMDLQQVTPERVRQAQNAVDGLLAAEDQKKVGAQFDLFIRFSEGLRAAGAEQLAAEMQLMPSAETQPASTQPAPKAALAVRLKEGVTPEAFTREMGRLLDQMREVFPDSELHLNKGVVAKSLGGRWISVSDTTVVPFPREADKEIVATFTQSLERQKGAVIRLAWRVTNDQKKEMAEAALAPGAMMFGGIANQLRAMKTACVGVFPGENPRADIILDFEETDQAAQFKTAVDKLVMGLSQIMGMASMMAEGEGAKAMEKQQAALRATMAPFMLQQKGGLLTTSVDVEQLKRIKRMGEEAKAAMEAATQPK